MSTNQHATWMVSAKSFIGLLGAEYGLMRDGGVLKRFYISSLLIVAIFLITGVSIFYAIELLFHSIWVEILLATFFCFLFVCIYIFLINTFAKENRPGKGLLNASNIIRAGFIAFMGLQVAQPLMILLFSQKLSPAVEKYKQQLLVTHLHKIDKLTDSEITHLQAGKLYYDTQKSMYGTTIYDKQLDKINAAIKEMQWKASVAKTSATQTIEQNSFFLFQVGRVNRSYPLSWLLTLLTTLLFLLPGYLVYSISSRNEYYQLKKAQEKKLVMASYDFFLMRHKILFSERVKVFSRYEDPPFNTTRKKPPTQANNEAFLKKYLEIR